MPLLWNSPRQLLQPPEDSRVRQTRRITSRVARSLSGSRQPHRWPRLVSALIYSWKSNCNVAWSREESWLPAENRRSIWTQACCWRTRWGRSWTIVSLNMVRMHSRHNRITERKSPSILNNPSSTTLRFGSVKLLLPCVCLLTRLLPLMGSLIKCADGALTKRYW